MQGLKNMASPQTTILYAAGCAVNSSERSGFAEAIKTAELADAVVLVVGESADMSGEAASRSSLDLPGVQEDLVKAVYATGRPVVVVMMNGRPLSIPWIAENVPAVVEAWFLGVQTGHAVADVLFGNVNPSGKLPVTIPRTVGQVPMYYNYKSTGRPGDENERFTSQYKDLPLTPLFPFGYGLSYTTYAYDNIHLSSLKVNMNDTLRIWTNIENTGSRAGDEIVQLYIRDDCASITRPVKELKGFKKVHLNPGEKREVRFELSPGDLSFYGREMKKIVEPGTFTVLVGTSSVETRQISFELSQ